MAKRKRWGKKFEDKRDWKIENEKYVVRGEFLLDLDWVKNWDKELEEMNKGKVGPPFDFPESFIKLQGVWYQWISYRGLEGIARRFQEFGLIPRSNTFSTINRRVNKIDTDFELPKEGSISVSTDGSGMKMTNRGEYKESKYGKGRKKYLKVTISADPYKKKLLKIDVSIDGEGESEPEIAMSHLEELTQEGYDINTFFGDGTFDVRNLFNLLEKYAINSAIKIRKNASTKARGSMRRAKEVKDYKKEGYKRWAEKRKYGQRWTGTEGIFSAVKRIFGENTRAKKSKNMIHEVKMKFWAYDRMRQYAKT